MGGARSVCQVIAFCCALASVAQAGPLDTIYDEQELADLQPRFERGWLNNYKNVVAPVLTAQELSRFANTRVQFLRTAQNREPFGFYSGGGQVFASTASLKFLFEVALAERWLEANGYAITTVEEYLTMLRFWDARRGRPPKPLATLCIPPESSMDPKIVEHAEAILSDAALFVMLHEYGHVLYGHPGNQISAEQSRLNEQAADAFALDVFARLHGPPISIPFFFFVETHLFEFTADAPQQASLAARTHPVSPDRLQAIARSLATQAQAYAKGFKSGDPAAAMNLALQISKLANLLADPMVQRYSLITGSTVGPNDLAPRPKGRNLSAPCDGHVPSGLPFDGTLRGKVVSGGVELNMDMVLRQGGDMVSGSFNYGNGIVRLAGKVVDAKLVYAWQLGERKGLGLIVPQGNSYLGTWAEGSSTAIVGTFELKKAP